MKNQMKWLIVLLMMATLLAGCRGDDAEEKSGGAQMLDVGDSRFLMVTLEGTGADSAQVTAIQVEEKDGAFEAVQEFDLYPGEGNVYCILLEKGGEYMLRVTGPDGTEKTCFVVFDESQVCSLNICMDPKPSDGTRTLWPETPHNSPDSE